MSEFKPGTKVEWIPEKKLGRVLAPSPLGYRFVRRHPDGTEEEAVEVKWLEEIGGGILSPRELRTVEEPTI